jgi:hypothetical protein
MLFNFFLKAMRKEIGAMSSIQSKTGSIFEAVVSVNAHKVS